MPIHEYLLPNGKNVERLYLHGEEIPSEITILGEIALKTVSRTVNKFKGAFSGGTTGKDRLHIDDGSIVEPGREHDVTRNRDEIEKKQDEERTSYIQESLAEFDV